MKPIKRIVKGCEQTHSGVYRYNGVTIRKDTSVPYGERGAFYYDTEDGERHDCRSLHGAQKEIDSLMERQA